MQRSSVLLSLLQHLCCLVAEYCASVWSRSAHVGLVDLQRNSTMRLITETFEPIPTPWLPVLTIIAPIAPPSFYWKETTDELIHWPVYKNIHEHPEQRLMSRAPLWKTAWAINSSRAADPTTRLPEFDLPRGIWSRFCTAQGYCPACRKTLQKLLKNTLNLFKIFSPSDSTCLQLDTTTVTTRPNKFGPLYNMRSARFCIRQIRQWQAQAAHAFQTAVLSCSERRR